MIHSPATPEDVIPPEALIARRIAAAAGVFGVASALGCWALAGGRAALSSAVATLLGTVNLWAMAQLIGRLINTKGSAGSKGPAAALYVVKAVGFFVLAGYLVSRPWMHHEGFMAGFTAVVLAIVVGGMWGGSDESTPDERE